MKKYTLYIFLSLLFTTGCQDNATQTPMPSQQPKAPTTSTESSGANNPQDMSAALNEIAKLGEQIQNGTSNGSIGKVDPVDFRQLKELLPANAGNLPRKDATGEKAGALGMVMSHAEGKYQDTAKNSAIRIKITDTGSLKGFAMMGFSWAMTTIDRESDNGFERTTKINGNPGYEKYDNPSQSGQVAVIVGNRFVVEVEGDGVNMDMIKSVLNQLDLNKLASWKDVGVTPS